MEKGHIPPFFLGWCGKKLKVEKREGASLNSPLLLFRN
jgi:hypothetical protein